MSELKVRRQLFLKHLTNIDREDSLGWRTSLEAATRDHANTTASEPVIDDVLENLQSRLDDRHRIHLQDFFRSRSLKGLGLLLSGMLIFGLGLTSNYLGSSGKVNLLLNPFMILLLWNLVVFFGIIVIAIARRRLGSRNDDRSWWPRLSSRMHHLSDRLSQIRHGGLNRAQIRLLSQAEIGFMGEWWRRYGEVSRARFGKLMHGFACVLVLGVIAGLYLRGLVQAYEFTWSSTFLTRAESVSQLLGVVFGPILLIARPLFPQGLPQVEGSNGADWIHLFALAGLVYVMVPRIALWFWQERTLQRQLIQIKIDRGDPFVQRILGSLGGVRTCCPIISYSFSPSEDNLRHLKLTLRQLLGPQLEAQVMTPVAWGETEPPADVQRVDAGNQFQFVVCFNGSQTPEEEAHGAFLRSFDLLVDSGGESSCLAVVVDSQKVGAERESSRRTAWNQLCHQVGLGTPLWVDLSQPFHHQALEPSWREANRTLPLAGKPGGTS